MGRRFHAIACLFQDCEHAAHVFQEQLSSTGQSRAARGAGEQHNAKFFFSGAWDLVGPKVQSGEFTVPSGKAPKTNDEWASIGIPAWQSATAQSEMENRLNSFYSGKKVNIVLSPNDSLALGIQQALDGAGPLMDVLGLREVLHDALGRAAEQGKIVERGDHAELLEQKGKYYQLYHFLSI